MSEDMLSEAFKRFKTIVIKEESFKANGFNYHVKLISRGEDSENPDSYETVLTKHTGGFPKIIICATNIQDLAQEIYSDLKTAALNNQE